MKASKIMTLEVVAVPADLSIEKTHQLMRRLEVRHLPVVSEGRLAGIVSDRDLFLVMGKEQAGAEAFIYPPHSVGQVMSLAPISAGPDVPVSRLARMMLEAKIDSLPIVSAKQELIGLVTSSDLIRVLALLPDEVQPTFSYHLHRVDDLYARA
jgi:acetoin utilization protein AcuB